MQVGYGLGGDGQVTLGDTVMEATAQKVRTLKDGKILAGFAGVALTLALIGLFILILTSEPLPAGMGLLTLVSGFGLYYDVTSPGLASIGVLATIDLTMGLAISYLVTVRALTGRVL